MLLACLLTVVIGLAVCWYIFSLRRSIWQNLARTHARVFISYRRKDSLDIARALKRDVDREFGRGTAFLDEGSIDGGADYPPAILRSLQQSDVVFVLVDKEWDLPRFAEKTDWVANEIRFALDLGTCVPVRLDGCEMPKRESLPVSLFDFVTKQAMTLCRDKRYEADLPLILDLVRQKTPLLALEKSISRLDRTTLATTIIVAVIMVLASTYLWFSPQLTGITETIQTNLAQSSRFYPFDYDEFVERSNLGLDTEANLSDMNVDWVAHVVSVVDGNLLVQQKPDSIYMLTLYPHPASEVGKVIDKLKENDRVRFRGRINDMSVPTNLDGTVVDLFVLR